MKRALRGLVLVGGWLVAALVVAWLGARLWALHVVRTAVPEFEAAHGSLDRAQWARKAPPATDNGGAYLRAAVLLFDTSGEEGKRWRQAVRQAGGDPTSEAALHEAAAVAERNRDALALLHKGAALPHCVLFEEFPSPNESIPNLTALLSMARLERGLAHADLARGDESSAAARLVDLFRVARCLHREPALIVHLVGAGLERGALRGLHDALAAGRLDGWLEPLSQSLSRDELPSTETLMRGEAAVFRPGAWWRDLDLVARDSLDSLANPFDVEGWMGAMGLRAMSRAIEALEAPAPPAPWAGARWPIWETDRYLFAFYSRNFWTKDRQGKAQASVRELARAALAARRAGLAHGAYPADSSALPELVLSTPLAGERVRYARADDGSVTLSLPESEGKWREIETMVEETLTVDWSWTLPPLPGAGRAGAPAR